MAFPEADIEKSSEQKPEVQVQGCQLKYCLIILILTHLPGEICGGSSSELTETERLDKEMVERWKSEADSVLVFVCAGFTILGVYSLNNMFQQGRSVHGCRLSLPRRKLQMDISRSKRPDQRSTPCVHRPTRSNIATVLQQLTRDTCPERRS